jgi:hypothetical protein
VLRLSCSSLDFEELFEVGFDARNGDLYRVDFRSDGADVGA